MGGQPSNRPRIARRLGPVRALGRVKKKKKKKLARKTENRALVGPWPCRRHVQSGALYKYPPPSLRWYICTYYQGAGQTASASGGGSSPAAPAAKDACC